MKKPYIMLICLVILLLMAACDNTPSDTTRDETSINTTPSTSWSTMKGTHEQTLKLWSMILPTQNSLSRTTTLSFGRSIFATSI